MRPILTAVIAAIEAGAVALAGVVVVAIPALLLWLVTFEMAADPAVLLGGSVSMWLLAHLIPLSFRLSPEAALGFGLPPEAVSFTLSLAPLGLTLVTVLLAMRAGVRFGRSGGSGVAGVIGGVAGFAGVASVVSQFGVGVEEVSPWTLILIPAAIYGASATVAFVWCGFRDSHPWAQRAIRALRSGCEYLRLPATAMVGYFGSTLRLWIACLAGLTVLSTLAVTLALVMGYVDITALSQSLQLDPLGATVLFLLQLLLLPVTYIWSISWLSGAGFAIGTGSSISPFGALTGPLPALPIFGAIPQGWEGTAVLAPALIGVLGIGIGVLSARSTELLAAPWYAPLAVHLCAGALVGVSVAGLSFLAVGSLGPERLADVGPQPWVVGGLVAAEMSAGLLIGAFTARVDGARLRTTLELARSVGAAGETREQVAAPDSTAVPPLPLFHKAPAPKKRRIDPTEDISASDAASALDLREVREALASSGQRDEAVQAPAPAAETRAEERTPGYKPSSEPVELAELPELDGIPEISDHHYWAAGTDFNTDVILNTDGPSDADATSHADRGADAHRSVSRTHATAAETRDAEATGDVALDNAVWEQAESSKGDLADAATQEVDPLIEETSESHVYDDPIDEESLVCSFGWDAPQATTDEAAERAGWRGLFKKR